MDVEIKTMDLSFCGEVAQNVVNKEAKEFVLQQLKSKYGVGINDNRAYILHDKSVYFLEKTQHIISIKSSGTNYLLFLTRINNTNYCFYIDRKIAPGYTVPRIIATKYGFSDTVFKDTLLDGELVKNDKNQWMFLITDILVHEGKKLESNIISRFNLLYSMLKNCYNVDKDFDICPLVVKRLFRYSEYDYLITQFIPSLTYKTKGLYFNTLNTKHGNQLFIFPNERQHKSHNSSNTSHMSNSSHYRGNNYSSSSLNVNADGGGGHSSSSGGGGGHSSSSGGGGGRSSGGGRSGGGGGGGSGSGGGGGGGGSGGVSNKSNGYIFRLETTLTPEIYNLYYKDGSDVIKCEKPAYIHGLRNSKMIRKFLSGSHTTYVYCKFNATQKMWEPITKAEISSDEYLSSKQSIETNA